MRFFPSTKTSLIVLNSITLSLAAYKIITEPENAAFFGLDAVCHAARLLHFYSPSSLSNTIANAADAIQSCSNSIDFFKDPSSVPAVIALGDSALHAANIAFNN